MYTFTCPDCNSTSEYENDPKQRKRCPDCAQTHRKIDTARKRSERGGHTYKADIQSVKLCNGCGDEFVPNDHRSKMCSQCYNIGRPCDGCGERSLGAYTTHTTCRTCKKAATADLRSARKLAAKAEKAQKKLDRSVPCDYCAELVDPTSAKPREYPTTGVVCSRCYMFGRGKIWHWIQSYDLPWNGATVNEILDLFRYPVCAYCGATENFAVDHVIPTSAGGSNDIENLAVACVSCNCSKGNMSVEEFQATLI